MRPFDNLRDALESDEDVEEGQAVRSDHGRLARTGTPEVIYAARKSVEQILSGVEGLVGQFGRVVISQLQPGAADALQGMISKELQFSLAPGNRAALIARAGSATPVTGGRVAVISAGTSDIPVAAEAALIAAEMGCTVRTTWDVGVAGIHRLVRPLEALIRWDADVVVVAAGMDGILPTVVSGLVTQPIIGLPISSGYGFGGDGIGALTTMLQTCSPGIAVVNIDNGIGAGITAARIANQAAKGRQTESSDE